MSVWLSRSGYALALSGGFLLSPAEDLLPLEFWAWMHGHSGSSTYYSVVPGEDSKMLEFSPSCLPASYSFSSAASCVESEGMRPNLSVKPTRSGLRPPRAAYLKRWSTRIPA